MAKAVSYTHLDDNLHIQAGHDVDIAADTNHFKNKRVETKKTSGVFTGGGIGITFGLSLIHILI